MVSFKAVVVLLTILKISTHAQLYEDFPGTVGNAALAEFKEKIEKRFQDSEHHVKLLEARIAELEAENKEQQMEISLLKEKLESEKHLTKTSKESLATLASQLPGQGSGDDEVNSDKIIQIDEPEIGLNIFESGTPSQFRRAENESPVAFFATISQHHIEHAGASQPIVFDNVITNVGHAYDSNVGTFIAPVSGIYVFSTTLFSVHDVSFHASFMKNSQLLTVMYIGGYESGYDTSSQTIVLQLQKGDDVYVQNNDADRYIHGYSHSIFSGFLLQEEYLGSPIVGK